MPVIYKCPNCGAAMEFDSDTQKLGCKRCGTQIDVETYEKDSAASGEQREKVPNMKIYNCQSCGAQLVADEYTSATFLFILWESNIGWGQIAGRIQATAYNTI